MTKKILIVEDEEDILELFSVIFGDFGDYEILCARDGEEALRITRADNPEELQRIGVLRQIFLDKLPESVLPELRDIRQMGLEGTSLIRRLEALRLRYRLNPPTEDETQETTVETEVVRIVCSEGLF